MGYCPWYLAVIGKFCHLPNNYEHLMVPFERSLSKQIVEIGSMILCVAAERHRIADIFVGQNICGFRG